MQRRGSGAMAGGKCLNGTSQLEDMVERPRAVGLGSEETAPRPQVIGPWLVALVSIWGRPLGLPAARCGARAYKEGPLRLNRDPRSEQELSSEAWVRFVWSGPAQWRPSPSIAPPPATR